MEERGNILTLAAEYENMKQDRQPYLDKALIAARYTIPSLITDDTQKNKSQKILVQPNQSVGADGINNLSSKVTLTMLPPNQTFYKFAMDELSMSKQAALTGVTLAEYETGVNRGLALIEKLLLDSMEQTADRVCFGEAAKHLYVAGNVFFIDDPKEGLRMYPLNRYVVKRDYCGNVLKAITEEQIGIETLSDEVKELVLAKLKEKDEGENCVQDERELSLYTAFRRKKNKWEVYQEVEGVEIPSSRGSYPIDVCPFIALRYTRIEGESYGRGLIEEYIGDISYLDTLSLAIRETSLAASKLLMLVNPAGLTKIKHLSEAKNGDFVNGRPDDVQPLQANKYYDLQTAQAEADKIERRLNRIFVMKAAIQRDAERVTAEEIRQMAADLEESLGNHYSMMCKEFQTAYVKIKFFHLKKSKGKDMPDIIRDKSIKLTVTTGLEALGRNSDLNKWSTFFDVMAQFAQAAQVVGAKTELLAKKVAASLNLDIEGVMYTEEEKQQMQQQAQQQALLQKAAPSAVNKYGDMMLQQQAQQQENS